MSSVPAATSIRRGLGRLLRRDGWDRSQREAHKLVAPFTMLNQRRLVSLWNQVVQLEREQIAGALVECGVWKGGAVAWMAAASRSVGGLRDLHLFDVFDDICEPDPAVDGERAIREVRELGGLADPQGRLRPVTGIYDVKGGHGTEVACREVLERVGHPHERQRFHVGWFQETVPAANVGAIALLRIDGDWYASTKVCLEHLCDRVVPGGFVVIDDYNAYEGCKLAVDEFLGARGLDVTPQPIDANAVWWRTPLAR